MGKYVLGFHVQKWHPISLLKPVMSLYSWNQLQQIPETRYPPDDSISELDDLLNIEEIISDQADTDGTMFVSELKTLLRLRPEFSEKVMATAPLASCLIP